MFGELKKVALSVLLVFLMTGVSSFAAESSIKIDADFPGGNIIVEKIEGNVVRLDRDIRDTRGDWFYWAFRIRGAENQSLKFVFKHRCVGARGPAVSLDQGKTWRWLGDKGFSWTEFSYKFGPNDRDVCFAFSMVYTQETLQRFLDANKNKFHLTKKILCRSKKGREVEYYTFGNPNNPNKLGAVLTCRHHACEMMAEYAIEGIVEEIFSGSDDGKWLLDNVEFIWIPFVDKDGVEDGDQGKNRFPHDHNRDYIQKIHPEIKAITTMVPEWGKDKRLFLHDFHCPWTRDGINEILYYPGPQSPYMAAQLKRFADILTEKQKGGIIPYRESNNLPFGKSWNIGTQNDKHRMFRQWTDSLLNAFFGNTIEIPYANSEGAQATVESVRQLGHNMARTMRVFIEEEVKNPTKNPGGNAPYNPTKNSGKKSVENNNQNNETSNINDEKIFNKEGKYLRISGVYPHMTAYNQYPNDKKRLLEAGIGALVPWAGKLWYLTYPQHSITGSSDKLYSIDKDLHLTVHPESLGGTHANRLIHRETNQLFIGYYAIDENGKIRTFDPHKLVGRMTSTMRHLFDPAGKIYFYDMEGAIYEADVHTLKVTKLFKKAFPGWHGKGAYTGQNRVVFANNGGTIGQKNPTTLLVGGVQKYPEQAGILAQWNGKRGFEILHQRQFTDVTGPGGIYGAKSDSDPIWSIGWDKRSVMLELLDHGTWKHFRVPKASHAFDPRHGWFTEWPRIRETIPGKFMMVMHATLFDFPKTFSSENTAGIRPISSHLRYIPDLCGWNGQIVLASDEASMQENPMCGQAQSNLWFGSPDDLKSFGPKIGWGGPWRADSVKKNEPSDPYLFAGYNQRILHMIASPDSTFEIQIDGTGKGNWKTVQSFTVGKSGYFFHIFDPVLQGEWIRLVPKQDGKVTAYFHYFSSRQENAKERELFDSLGDVAEFAVTDPAPTKTKSDSKNKNTTKNAPATEKEKNDKNIALTNKSETMKIFSGGIIRPAMKNRALQWLCKESFTSKGKYYEVRPSSDGTTIRFTEGDPADLSGFVKVAARNAGDYSVDSASVIIKDAKGNKYRLPKGAKQFDQLTVRGLRELESERYMAQYHGTFYEIPRIDLEVRPNYEMIKPVASHSKMITDYCTWRGLLVLCGTKKNAKQDGHFFANSQGEGLWFGQIDDLWKLGKPVGTGGPLLNTAVKTGQLSDPYLMTGYDEKSMTLSHDFDKTVTFNVMINFDHNGYVLYKSIKVPAGQKVTHEFPKGFQAHWLRVSTDCDCRATVHCVWK